MSLRSCKLAIVSVGNVTCMSCSVSSGSARITWKELLLKTEPAISVPKEKLATDLDVVAAKTLAKLVDRPAGDRRYQSRCPDA